VAKILIVDDEKDVRSFLRRAIEKIGHEVVETPDGSAALETYRDDAIDMCFVDVNMPVMDGIAFLEEVKKRDESAIVVIMTGFPSAETIIETVEDDGYTYIAKPLRLEQIKDLVERGLAARKQKNKSD